MRSGSHRAKIKAEKAIGHWIAKMAKLFQYCSLHMTAKVGQMKDSEMVRSARFKVQCVVSDKLFQRAFLSVNPDY